MTDDLIMGINQERAAAQRRLRFKRYLRQQGVPIPQSILRNERALLELFYRHQDNDNDTSRNNEVAI